MWLVSFCSGKTLRYFWIPGRWYEYNNNNNPLQWMQLWSKLVHICVFLENLSQHDEAMQRLSVQHAFVKLGRLLGAEQQDAGEGRDWLEWDGEGAVGLSRTQVGPLSTVDHTHLDLGIWSLSEHQDQVISKLKNIKMTHNLPTTMYRCLTCKGTTKKKYIVTMNHSVKPKEITSWIRGGEIPNFHEHTIWQRFSNSAHGDN